MEDSHQIQATSTLIWISKYMVVCRLRARAWDISSTSAPTHNIDALEIAWRSILGSRVWNNYPTLRTRPNDGGLRHGSADLKGLQLCSESPDSLLCAV